MDTSSDDDASTQMSSGAAEASESLRLYRQPSELVVDDSGDISPPALDDGLSLTSLTLDDGTPSIKPRAYQVEMLEESLAKNVIVAMDTGSGKTHIAVLRILHELEHIPTSQFIWFLAPTVALCSQQFEYIKSQISGVQVKFLSGADNVDRWSEQSLWDAILRNVKVVVSTYQVLLDGLVHGFIRMESLALIVFDEAHNCVGKHPGAKIMEGFYRKRKSDGLLVPHILGLTASPVMRSSPESLHKIEETLDAICRTPKKHRAELRMQVKLPKLEQITYKSLPPIESLTNYTRTISSLSQAYAGLNIIDDPYIIELRKENTEKSLAKLRKIIINNKTWCQDQIRTIYATSLKICSELGGWAADFYISEVVTKFLKMVDEKASLMTWDVSSAERKYVADALRMVEINQYSNELPKSIPLVSDKFDKLKVALLHEPPGYSGIVFVKERATVAALAHLLSMHPETRGRFRVGTMVGTSTNPSRTKNVGELINVDEQRHTLSSFKEGTIQLIIATSVLEEGIDIPSCNFVVCYEKPANLKSFVQRRGRARHRDSKLVLLLDAHDDKTREWQQLEQAMKKLYEDDMRVLQEALIPEDTEEHDHRRFTVESTGAMIDLDNAIAHLYHFCATLPAREYVDLRPEFICFEAESSYVRARVILPLSVNEAVRTAQSRNSWKSEKNAMKDAAFEAYVALYNSELVNQNLLPLLRHDAVIDELTNSAMEKRASLLGVNEQHNPWIDVAEAWHSSSSAMAFTIRLDQLKLVMFLPVKVPDHSYLLYWDAETTVSLIVTSEFSDFSKSDIFRASEDTLSIFQAAFGHRFQIQLKTPVVVFTLPDEKPLKDRLGFQPVAVFGQMIHGLVRDQNDIKVRYIFKKWLAEQPIKELVQMPYENYESYSKHTPHLSLVRHPRRHDFLHKVAQTEKAPPKKPFSSVLPISNSVIEDMPIPYVRFGMFIPSIMRKLEIYILAEMLSSTILKPVGIQDINLIVTAISASSANENTNYQRLEFSGDSILKLCTSVQLMAEYPLWHEGYLSAKKDRLVSNSRLSRSAVEVGLDKFIITKAFTGYKWRPSYVEDLLEMARDGKRQVSTKVLADVVEALIGAAMVDGGISKALACLDVFLPEQQWLSLELRRTSLFEQASVVELPVVLEPLEELIGYRFRKKSILIEAMSHASYMTGSGGSLERLEFLGDSILDHLIVQSFSGHDLSHVQMHLLRTAMVNADFLAFLCMEWSIGQEGNDAVQNASEDGPIYVERTTNVLLPLWRFMRHHAPKLGEVQINTAKRHAELRADIKTAIESGSHYPWALLSRLQALKFYSDIVESLLGAVWIDSGSFDVCYTIIEKMGILPYLRRILRDGVVVWHPKEQLGLLADDKTVQYRIGLKVSGEGQNTEREYTCKVMVGEEEIVEVDGGVGKEEVMARVAEKAVEILIARKENEAVVGVADGADTDMKG